MAEERTYPLLPEDKCLTEQQLFDYIDGKLPDAERHLAEKHMLDCPLCADALEGLMLVKNRDRVAAFTLPPGNGADKIAPKVIPLSPRRRTLYAVAAALVLLLGISVVLKLALDGSIGGTMADAAQENKDAISPDEENRAAMDSIASPDDFIAGADDQRAVTEPAAEKMPADDAPAPPPMQVMQGHVSNGEAQADFGDREYIVSATDANGCCEDKKLDELSSGSGNTSGKPEASKNDPKTGAMKASEEEGNSKQNDKDQADRLKLKTALSKKETTNTRSETAGSTAPQAPQGGVVMDAPQEQQQTEDIVLYQTDTTVAPRMYPHKPSDNDLDLCYTNGVKMLESGQAVASIAFFDQVIEYPQHRHFEDAQWKKAEALVKLNRTIEAKALLNEIVKKGGKYKTQAEEKLKTL